MASCLVIRLGIDGREQDDPPARNVEMERARHTTRTYQDCSKTRRCTEQEHLPNPATTAIPTKGQSTKCYIILEWINTSGRTPCNVARLVTLTWRTERRDLDDGRENTCAQRGLIELKRLWCSAKDGLGLALGSADKSTALALVLVRTLKMLPIEAWHTRKPPRLYRRLGGASILYSVARERQSQVCHNY